MEKIVKEYALLHLEQHPNQTMRLKLHGHPADVARMITASMHVSTELAAAFMAPVIEYCQQRNIDCGDLSKMVTIKDERNG
jgi:hypothetical protein